MDNKTHNRKNQTPSFQVHTWTIQRFHASNGPRKPRQGKANYSDWYFTEKLKTVRKVVFITQINVVLITVTNNQKKNTSYFSHNSELNSLEHKLDSDKIQ